MVSPRAHLQICAVLGGVLSLLVAWSGTPPPRPHISHTPPPACPPRLREDHSRAQRMWRQLKRTTLGARLLQGLPPDGLRLCFGDVSPSVIRTDGVIHMDRRLTHGEDTARLGHLLHHHRTPIVLKKQRPCLPQLRRAIHQEAIAISTELRLRRAFGVSLPRRWFAFRHAYWQTPTKQRHDLIYRQLWHHPRGARGIPALRSQYQRALGCRLPRPPL